MNILGISAFYHDSSACLVRDGEIIAAAQEERFTRLKHDPNFPAEAAAYVLHAGGIGVENVDLVAFYDKPFLKFERLLRTYLNEAPLGLPSFLAAMPLWMKQKLLMPKVIARELGYDGPQIYPEHHESHAASAFFPSPFEHAAFITFDGVGEWTTMSWGTAAGNKINIRADIHYPHSIGMLYSAFTYFLGFRVNSGEYKVMGLAPYGEPKYAGLIKEHLIDIKPDGSYKLNMKYFTYLHGLRMTGRRFEQLLGIPRRLPETELRQEHMDLARSIQVVTEEVMLKTAAHVHRQTGEKNLCLAGGVSLNCVGNGRVLREGPFADIWIQPAAGDAGGALGAALFAWYQYLDRPRTVSPAGRDSQKGSLLGPEYSDAEIETFLQNRQIPYHRLAAAAVAARTAELLAAGKVVGWFQGRMEFGPRALGARSILGDPRDSEMQRTMNLKIKYRESFRPFAPTVAVERISDWFAIDRPSPYMLLVAPVAASRLRPINADDAQRQGLEKLRVVRSEVPAITHVDGSARLQSVDPVDQPRYHELLVEFEKRTGVPIVINTSFNVRGEPIVRTPEDAYRCFMRTEIEALVLGRYLLHKAEQPAWNETADWRKEFKPD
ncbi:MAG: carbamoyltransferase [Myxococcales bacterium]|nr:carbamoyltransferase [Myxococcales bacterium]